MIFDKFLGKSDKSDEKFIDKQTGLYSREYINEAEKEFLRKKYALLILDIDNFDKINQFYGKDIGNKLLTELAKILKASIRKGDKIVRIGGDEFLILLNREDIADIPPYAVAERIIQKLDASFITVESNKIKVTVSAGFHPYPDKDATLIEAIEKAYKALTAAKQRGKNRIEIYDTGLDTFSNKKLMEIKEAITENRVICFYQPIFDIQTLKAVKYESLVRIKTKDGKIISPGAFLSQVVNTVVYKELTKRVIEYNLFVIKEKKIQVSINLLPNDITDNDINYLLFKVDRQIRDFITIEILESENVSNYKTLREHLNQLKEAGYKIALDDFGSGYSNLMHVVELKFDYLKIDGQIVRKIDNDPVSYSVVKAIKGFASELGIDTIAEFISSKEIFDKVREIGIKYGQGNYFKEAIPASLIR